jgi:hypothetical protein
MNRRDEASELICLRCRPMSITILPESAPSILEVVILVILLTRSEAHNRVCEGAAASYIVTTEGIHVRLRSLR